MTFQMKDDERSGKYLFLHEGKPVVMDLLEDLGKIPVVGKYAINEQGDHQYWEAFKVRAFSGVEAAHTTLVGPWRLRKALREALEGNTEDEPRVEVTMTYVMERLKTGPKTVKQYKVVVQKKADIPF